jgi:hypothetical protein
MSTTLNSMIKHDQPWKYEPPNEVKKPLLEMVKTAEG